MRVWQKTEENLSSDSDSSRSEEATVWCIGLVFKRFLKVKNLNSYHTNVLKKFINELLIVDN